MARKRPPIFKITSTSRKKNKTKRTHSSTSTLLALIDEESSVGRTWTAATAPVHSQRCSHDSSEKKGKLHKLQDVKALTLTGCVHLWSLAAVL